MKFHDIILEASQDIVKKLDKIEAYFSRKGEFKKLYPKQWKKIHHVRRENYKYSRGGKNWYGVLIILKDKFYQDDLGDFVEIIKDLEICKDNNVKVEKNNLIIKILVPESRGD